MFVPGYIYKIKYNKEFNNYIILFRNNIDLKIFSLYLNTKDAKNVSLAKSNISSSKLATYDTITNLLNLFSINIGQILVSEKNNQIHSKIIFHFKKENYELYVPIVDAIILSLNSYIPLQIKENLFNQNVQVYIEKKLTKNFNKDKLSKNNSIETLNKSLKKLIKIENYESAAIIRDRIINLKNNK
tara:strand:+ start:607 stop:1164 length:558 start_codon:yes stop_codon:yes gene_type:complete